MGLREEIQYAFAKTPYPGDQALTSCSCEEYQWEVCRFRGKKWSRLTLEDVSCGDGGNVVYLTPAAFHYFLPGLMLLVLDHGLESGTLDCSIVSRFAASDRDEEGIKRVAKMINRLSLRQRRVIVDFLRHLEPTGFQVPEVLRSAIENLHSGDARPYSQEAVEQWLAETYGRKVWPSPLSGQQPEKD
jgi:hypothetical protein